MTRRIAAHFVFSVSRPPIAKGMVEVDQDGIIINLSDPEGDLRETAGMEFHNGILCPAFTDLFHEFSPELISDFFPELKKFETFMPFAQKGNYAILNWMKAIQQTAAEISLEYLIRLFCLETARQLGRQDETGTLEPGKHPGILLIDRMDYRSLRLSPDSRVKRLI
ncbi:MAG: hypothetical protein AAGU19_00535 [Prolixibacteraceae bacterium]